MKLSSGLEILENEDGSGSVAQSGDTVVYNVRIFLNHGDEVPMNDAIAERGIGDERIRRENGRALLDHVSTLGKRQAIAGIEKSLLGMRVGGFRKVRVSPHLAYRETGIPGLIPANAVLDISIWLREVRNAG